MGLPVLQPGLRLVDGADINSISNLLNTDGYYYSTWGGAGGTLTTTQFFPSNATENYAISTGGATPTFTTPTAAQIIASQPNWNVGQSQFVRVLNTNSGTLTLAGGTGVTISGTATVATNTSRDFLVTYTSSTAQTITIQNVGSATV